VAGAWTAESAETRATPFVSDVNSPFVSPDESDGGLTGGTIRVSSVGVVTISPGAYTGRAS